MIFAFHPSVDEGLLLLLSGEKEVKEKEASS
jgi:hypothetical protein